MSMGIVYCNKIHDEKCCEHRRGHKGAHSWETDLVQMKKLNEYIKKKDLHNAEIAERDWQMFKYGFNMCRLLLNLEQD